MWAIIRLVAESETLDIIGESDAQQFSGAIAGHAGPSAFAVDTSSPTWLTSWSLGHIEHTSQKAL
jgi:hypothetical protein